MSYVQRVQFTASPTFTAEGSTIPASVAPGFGGQRMHLEGTQGDPAKTIKMDIGAEDANLFFPVLDSSTQYRVTIEEVTS